MLPNAALPQTTHMWELPPITSIVTDDIQHMVCYLDLHSLRTATLPPETYSSYGPRVTALVGHLHGTYHYKISRHFRLVG